MKPEARRLGARPSNFVVASAAPPRRIRRVRPRIEGVRPFRIEGVRPFFHFFHPEGVAPLLAPLLLRSFGISPSHVPLHSS